MHHMHLTKVGHLRLFCILLRMRNNGSILLLVMIFRLDLPLCAFSVDSMLGTEAGYFIAEVLCRKWEKPYGVVMSFVRARLSFAILRASNVVREGCTGQVKNF